MKETTPAAMPACFERWCKRFDDIWTHQAQKREFKNYIGGLLGESERKNLSQMADNAVGVTYHRLHHFLTEAPWSVEQVNERRLLVMNQCSQTRISRGFTLIVDDSGHRKSGNFTAGVGRQYIGEIGKTDNGIVVVTTHLYDGKKSLPLDIELYQHASSLPQGRKDLEFKKKPELALTLIDRSLSRGYRPGIVLIDAGYGNNTTFLLELEKRRLKYLGGLAKNRKVITQIESNKLQEIRLDQLGQSMPVEDFTPIQLNKDKQKTVWVATVEVELDKLEGTRTIAIVMNASTFDSSSDVDYFITNVDSNIATPDWIVATYAQRNWVEVFYREAKGWLGLSEYQVRDYRSLLRHFILVFCAYTFILWHTKTGGLRRRWASKPLNTFTEALEAFRTAMSFRFVQWLNQNWDVFSTYKEALGFIWA
ncbi:IS701 family transposase [Coleofasciculus sp. FACHB-64]|uniref:IS701 family transposase n=1 Tax=Cyanophyceae TaxID=3028117 RepID=UPI001685B2DA|nr:MULTISPECIES: IS701 family transposase [unclassified Coleofasciculus]MBD1841062.1 IS701 family transposase [Coleofasciculus sp. FACHB-501]MBD2046632.1 IS701 family transposase [Coleofasciculus sp. FACHB-64]